jgi:sulfide:quinone oxidoreductase
MIRNELDEALELVDSELKKSGISRREAFKLAGLGSAAYLMGDTKAEAATVLNASEAKGKILIIGGGMAGMATAARLSSTLTAPDITIIEPNPKSSSYQAGCTLIGAGIYEKADVMYDTKDFLPAGVTLIKDKAVEFKLGARGLRSICESIMLEAMFDLPSGTKKSFKVDMKYAESKFTVFSIVLLVLIVSE